MSTMKYDTVTMVRRPVKTHSVNDNVNNRVGNNIRSHTNYS